MKNAVPRQRRPILSLLAAALAVAAVSLVGWNWWPIFHLIVAVILILAQATIFYVHEKELARFQVRNANDERLIAQEELKRSEDRFRQLIEHAADAIFVYDHQFRFVEVNRQASESLGYTREELLAFSVADVEAPVIEADRPELQEQIVLGRPVTVETAYRRKDGSVFPAEVRITLLQVGGRALKLALVRDITERKRFEKAIQDQRNLLSEIIENIPCAVFWKDQDLVYRGCNAMFARSRGYTSSKDVIGKTDQDLIGNTAETAAGIRSDRELLRIGRPILNAEEKWQSPGAAAAAFVLSSKVPISTESGAARGILGIYTDITERKRLEEKFHQSQKMEAIGQLAGGVAHDFNNLLTAINGYTQIVREGLKENDPARELLREVVKAGERAAGLTRQLLAYSRRQVLQPKILDLNKIVLNLERMLRRLIGEDIELITSLSNGLNRVEVDPGQFEQVVMNLAVNARDAMPGGGTITIETRNVAHDDLPVISESNYYQTPYVMLEVRDNGAGMSPETLKRIFEPFFTTKEVGKGTGLGLATVHGIVKQSGGFVTVDSKIGHGTSFFVYLPSVAAEADPIAASYFGADDSPRGKETVLLVEDEPSLRSLTRLLLQRSGYTVIEAAAGHEAIEVAARYNGTIDLLLTDVVMPRMSGRQLAESLRVYHPRTKILYMSGYTADAVVRHGVQTSVVAFLEKPFTARGLASKLRQVLDGRS